MGHIEARNELLMFKLRYDDWYSKFITKEEMKYSRCLAEKSPYPSWMQKQLCKW